VKVAGKIRAAAPDLLAFASYGAFAAVVFSGLLRDPSRLMLADNRQDQVFFEWVLTHAARVVTHGESPLFTEELNAPYGINLMANTSVLGLAIPLSPITLLFGAGVTFALISWFALAGTASAWYYVLSRDVVDSRASAYVGGLFCGFGPAMISQDTGHPNIASQFLIPFIVRTVLRLREPDHRVRRGLTLAGLIVYQCFINEEILFLTALALGVFLLAALPAREIIPAAKVALPTLGLAALVSGAVLVYPLWHQFTGPMAYRGLSDWVLTFSSDIASFKEFSRRSIIGEVTPVTDRMGGPTEENTFFGWPLVLLFGAAAVALWRERAARALVITALIFAIASIGPIVRFNGEETKLTGPWKVMTGLPLFDSVVPTRIAVMLVPIVGVLLALLVDRFIFTRSESPSLGLSGRVVWGAAVAVALLPLIPTPQPVNDRPGVPQFFTSGQWRQHIPAGGTVVPIPGGNLYENLDGMEWSVAANIEFRVVGGYFLAPVPGSADRTAAFGALRTPTTELFQTVADNGQVLPVTQEQRDQARVDIANWQATTLVLPVRHPNSEAIHQVVDQLIGPGQLVDDVWLWDVRSLS
jgi:hypothetical protein